MFGKIFGIFAFTLAAFVLSSNAFAYDLDALSYVSTKVIQEQFVLSYYLSGFIILFGLFIYLQKSRYEKNELQNNFSKNIK